MRTTTEKKKHKKRQKTHQGVNKQKTVRKNMLVLYWGNFSSGKQPIMALCPLKQCQAIPGSVLNTAALPWPAQTLPPRAPGRTSPGDDAGPGSPPKRQWWGHWIPALLVGANDNWYQTAPMGDSGRNDGNKTAYVWKYFFLKKSIGTTPTLWTWSATELTAGKRVMIQILVVSISSLPESFLFRSFWNIEIF